MNSRTAVRHATVALGVMLMVMAVVAPATRAALVRLDSAATVFYGTNTGGVFGSWAGPGPDNIQNGNWESGLRFYSGFDSGASGDNWIGYAWNTPQSVSNIVLSDARGNSETSAPFTIEWSTGGAGAPETWDWTVLSSHASGPVTPHLVVDLDNVRGIRIHSTAAQGSYKQLSELGIYGGQKPVGQSFSPVTDPTFTTANTITPSGAYNINPDNLTAVSGTRTHWLRWGTGGAAGAHGPEAVWKGSWDTPQVIGGLILWGGAQGAGGSYYPSAVDTYRLYVLKGGADATSTDYDNDWILVAEDLNSIALDDAGNEVLFPDSFTTQGIALRQTGNPSGADSGYQNFSLYGGHLVILVGEVPEPASLVLFGLAGLVLLRRRR